MKNRTLALALTVCCLASFALADNPSDAPLASNDGNATLEQQIHQAPHQERRRNKKNAAFDDGATNASSGGDRPPMTAKMTPATSTQAAALPQCPPAN